MPCPAQCYNSRMNATENMEIWSISQLTRQVKGLLETSFGAVWLTGEISNWKVAASGHAYFTLKDEHSQIDAVIFSGVLSRVRFRPENGLQILAHGRVSVYERRGNYQIVLDQMQPQGAGALQLAFEQLKHKLEAEGLFALEHKKPLPMLPRRIGIVTSPTGAAIRDMLNVLGRRFSGLHVLLFPARVQGKEAAPEIVAGIHFLDHYGVDVIIIGRGGGSLEDLWPFNEEMVVRAVHQAKTPIISAVGHEVDFSLSDFAADLRAPTPSAAAELVVQERDALQERVRVARKRTENALRRTVDAVWRRFEKAGCSYVFQRPEELFRQKRQHCDELRMRFNSAMDDLILERRKKLEHLQRGLALVSPSSRLMREQERLRMLRTRWHHEGEKLTRHFRGSLHPLVAKLEALSPLAILTRGYALARKLPERSLVRDIAELSAGDSLEMRFGRGEARVRVESIMGDEHA